jgi:hypothetical protein
LTACQEEGARKILKAVAEKMPSLVIDVTDQLQGEEGPSSPASEEPDQPFLISHIGVFVGYAGKCLLIPHVFAVSSATESVSIYIYLIL